MFPAVMCEGHQMFTAKLTVPFMRVCHSMCRCKFSWVEWVMMSKQIASLLFPKGVP